MESKYSIIVTNAFKKDLSLMQKRGKDMSKLQVVVDLLCADSPLPPQYKDHKLKGNKSMFRELHVEPDWLLMYIKRDDTLILTLTRTGSHSDLLEK